MPLRVLVFDIDRRSKRTNGIAVNCPQIIVESAILFCSLSDLFDKAMCVYANSNVTNHRTDGVKILPGEFFATRLSAQQDKSRQFVPHDHRHDELNAHAH
jgi:hypothetical protein